MYDKVMHIFCQLQMPGCYAVVEFEPRKDSCDIEVELVAQRWLYSPEGATGPMFCMYPCDTKQVWKYYRAVLAQTDPGANWLSYQVRRVIYETGKSIYKSGLHAQNKCSMQKLKYWEATT